MPLNHEQLTRLLPGRRVQCFPVVSSTMTVAARAASEGAAHGSLFIAGEQTAGVGRFGRFWHSEPDAGIYLTIVMRLDLPAHSLAVVTLALGLAAAEAIRDETGIHPDLRWPNDVLIGERKVAGILAQLTDACLLAGIGINVNHTLFPDGLSHEATSLRIAAGGRPFPLEPLIAALAACVDRKCTMLVEQGPPAVIEEFTKVSTYARNCRVSFESHLGPDRGVTAGLDANGFLLVRRDSGEVVTVIAGGVRPERRAESSAPAPAR